MTKPISAGTVVEVTDRCTYNFRYAAAVDRPADTFAPNDQDTFVWVRYDNGCVVPVREWLVRAVPVDQVVARLNAR